LRSRGGVGLGNYSENGGRGDIDGLNRDAESDWVLVRRRGWTVKDLSADAVLGEGGGKMPGCYLCVEGSGWREKFCEPSTRSGCSILPPCESKVMSAYPFYLLHRTNYRTSPPSSNRNGQNSTGRKSCAFISCVVVGAAFRRHLKKFP
jgi:hypothetical protein